MTNAFSTFMRVVCPGAKAVDGSNIVVVVRGNASGPALGGLVSTCAFCVTKFVMRKMTILCLKCSTPPSIRHRMRKCTLWNSLNYVTNCKQKCIRIEDLAKRFLLSCPFQNIFPLPHAYLGQLIHLFLRNGKRKQGFN